MSEDDFDCAINAATRYVRCEVGMFEKSIAHAGFLAGSAWQKQQDKKLISALESIAAHSPSEKDREIAKKALGKQKLEEM